MGCIPVRCCKTNNNSQHHIALLADVPCLTTVWLYTRSRHLQMAQVCLLFSVDIIYPMAFPGNLLYRLISYNVMIEYDLYYQDVFIFEHDPVTPVTYVLIISFYNIVSFFERMNLSRV